MGQQRALATDMTAAEDLLRNALILRHRQCVFFAGAGFSAGTPAMSGTIPKSQELRRELNERKSQSENYLFWLQFAIACNAFGKYELADRYFGNVYRLVEAAKSDPFQIGNHHAKFLLKSPLERPDLYEDYSWAFNESHKLTLQQFRVRNDAKFPLEVFAMYGSFVDGVHRKFSEDESESTLATLNELKEELRSRSVGQSLARMMSAAQRSIAHAILVLSVQRP
jgi:hypothetical protein